MPSKHTEQRKHDRRTLELPVAFYANGDWDLRKHALGQTRDVSTQGACIRTSLDHMPDINSPLLLILIPETEVSFSNTKTAVRIRGKVVWVNSGTKQFGVSFS